MSELMTYEQAVRRLRADANCAALVRDAYLGEDVHEAAARFTASAEFAEVLRLLGQRVSGSTVLDVGAGNGIATYAFAMSGAERVYALEPDPSDEVGRGAIQRLTAATGVEVLNAFGEDIPLPNESVDIVYARQVLHHARDLSCLIRECARVLKSDGVLLACREHVVDNESQLHAFLDQHSLHRYTGGENAFPIYDYTYAIVAAGLKLDLKLGPWDSVINAFPAVRTSDELQQYPRISLRRRFGFLGTVASYFPGVTWLVRVRVTRPVPGRMYSFLASKPSVRTRRIA